MKTGMMQQILFIIPQSGWNSFNSFYTHTHTRKAFWTHYSCLLIEMMEPLFSEVHDEKTRGNSHKLQQGIFQLWKMY